MSIHQIVKDNMKEHKEKIELFQWAAIMGVSSLLYSEYLRNMRQKHKPVHMVLVPPIKRVQEFLDPNGSFMSTMSDDFINWMREDPLFKKFSHAPELVLFDEEHVEVLKTIFDLYVIPNMYRRIPETISMKFSLMNEEQQTFRESNELDLFDRQPLTSDQFSFIAHETVLQLMVLLPTMKKEIELPEENSKIHMTDDEILSIGNANAVCPIIVDPVVMGLEGVLDVLGFVTDTTFTKLDNSEICAQKHDSIVTWLIKSSPFNQIALTRLMNIAE